MVMRRFHRAVAQARPVRIKEVSLDECKGKYYLRNRRIKI